MSSKVQINNSKISFLNSSDTLLSEFNITTPNELSFSGSDVNANITLNITPGATSDASILLGNNLNLDVKTTGTDIIVTGAYEETIGGNYSINGDQITFTSDSIDLSASNNIICDSQSATFQQHLYIAETGSLTKDTAVALGIYSTTKGILPPRMTSTQKGSLSFPSNGLILYDTTSNELNIFESGLINFTSPEILAKSYAAIFLDASYSITSDTTLTTQYDNSRTIRSGVTIDFTTGFITLYLDKLYIINFSVGASAINLNNGQLFLRMLNDSGGTYKSTPMIFAGGATIPTKQDQWYGCMFVDSSQLNNNTFQFRIDIPVGFQFTLEQSFTIFQIQEI